MGNAVSDLEEATTSTSVATLNRRSQIENNTTTTKAITSTAEESSKPPITSKDIDALSSIMPFRKRPAAKSFISTKSGATVTSPNQRQNSTITQTGATKSKTKTPTKKAKTPTSAKSTTKKAKTTPKSSTKAKQTKSTTTSKTIADTTTSGLTPITSGVSDSTGTADATAVTATTTTTTTTTAGGKKMVPRPKKATLSPIKHTLGAGSSRINAVLLSEGPPDEKLKYKDSNDWPDGWIRRVYQRSSGATKGSTDRYWYSPKIGFKLRSLVEVRKFLAALEQTNGDEEQAKRIFKSITSV